MCSLKKKSFSGFLFNHHLFFGCLQFFKEHSCTCFQMICIFVTTKKIASLRYCVIASDLLLKNQKFFLKTDKKKKDQKKTEKSTRCHVILFFFLIFEDQILNLVNKVKELNLSWLIGLVFFINSNSIRRNDFFFCDTIF